MTVIYLSPEELVARYKGRITEKTLANWRTKGGGPRFTKIGGKIMYKLSAVECWERGRTFESTAKRVVGEFSAQTVAALSSCLFLAACSPLM